MTESEKLAALLRFAELMRDLSIGAIREKMTVEELANTIGHLSQEVIAKIA